MLKELKMLEIISYEKVPVHERKGKTIGYVDIKIAAKKGKMIIRSIAHMQDGEKEWFNLPARKRQGQEGKDRYDRYWEYESAEDTKLLLYGLRDQVKQYLEQNKHNETSNIDFLNEGLPF